MHSVAILGSTGSIGTQTLEVVAANPRRFSVTALAAYGNELLLEQQIDAFKPALAVLVDREAAGRLLKRYRGSTRILAGEEGLLEAASQTSASTVVTALVGFAGLRPTIAAIQAGKNIALANKETLVAAGQLVTTLARDKDVKILPVDSEHSAIFQCLQGEQSQTIRRLLITASGGPFRGYVREQLAQVSVADCLRHPNWSMGKKITVDSATLVNKGLEVMEAHWLYGVDYEHIDVLVHPQSIIHSLVEFVDGAVMAQLGTADMHLPIQYALTYPERLPAAFSRLDFSVLSALTFEAPDIETFPALALAYAAGRSGGSVPCVFNAANEIAVYAFLREELKFLDIATVIQTVMAGHTSMETPGLEDLFRIDTWARQAASDCIATIKTNG